MLKKTVQNVEIQANTRDHRGCFVPNEVYQLVEITSSGWALICPDNAVCHYVDPEHLHEAARRCFL